MVWMCWRDTPRDRAMRGTGVGPCAWRNSRTARIGGVTLRPRGHADQADHAGGDRPHLVGEHLDVGQCQHDKQIVI